MSQTDGPGTVTSFKIEDVLCLKLYGSAEEWALGVMIEDKALKLAANDSSVHEMNGHYPTPHRMALRTTLDLHGYSGTCVRFQIDHSR